MTIEVTRGQSRKKYRINPYNARVIDWRFTYRGARWQPYDSYADEQAARDALLQLEKEPAP